MIRKITAAFLASLFALSLSLSAMGQTTVSPTTLTIQNTVAVPNVLRPGINLGGESGYGPAQLLKNRNVINFGYLTPPIYQAIYPCNTGGTTQTTTSYYSLQSSTAGFPANFFVGATYTAVSQTGIAPVSGLITASTANNNTNGITFTLDTPLTAACTPGTSTANTDYLIVRQRNAPSGILTSVNEGFSPSSTFSTDVSPQSTNTYQSLSLTSGATQSFFMDASFGSWALDTTLGGATWLNINGTYTFTYKAKCVGGSGTGTVFWSVGRIGSGVFGGGTDTLAACTATHGSGWTTFSHQITGTEVGAQNETIQYSLSPTNSGGSVLFQDMDFIEGSTLAGNTTPFRDSVVRALQKINPGSLRLMTPPSWGSSVGCQIAAQGMRCVNGIKGYSLTSVQNSIGYDDFLQLAYLLKTTPYITLGHFNAPADFVQMVNWLSTSGWTAKFAALGLNIYLADGNEPWNPGAVGNQDAGNGAGYGSTMGPKMAAARGASGYTSTIKLVGANWFGGSQGHYPGGGTWISQVLTAAHCTKGASTCPDAMEIAPYTFTTVDNITNVHLDEVAEGANMNSAPCDYNTCSKNSTIAAQTMLSSLFGLNSTIYEMSYSPESGSATITQAQMNQISQSVSMALNTYRNSLLMERDAKIYGPRNEFAFVDQPYNGACCGTQQSSWTAEAYMAAGPGQLTTFTDVARAIGILMAAGNTAIGNNNSIMNFTQTGMPTYNYPGGQGGTISANSAVNMVDTFVRGDGNGHFTVIAFNMSPVNQTLNFAGSGAPAGTVTKTVFGAANALTDNNASSLSLNSPAAVVGVPSSTSLTNPTSDTLPANSVSIYTYSLTSTPTASIPTFSPAAGTYSTTQTVTLTTATTGATICYALGTAPTAPTAGTCGSGSTTYTSPITVSASQTIEALATKAGNANSAIGTATYNIGATTTLNPPTYAPSAGTYTSAQTVTLSVGGGATICYAINAAPTAPVAGTCGSGSTVYSSAISVTSSETIEALATLSGSINSSVATSAYVIALASPTFTPAQGSYSSTQSVSLTGPSGSTICYAVGVAPTAPTAGTCGSGSTTYTGAISVASTETIEALATKTGATNSAVASATYTISSAALSSPTFTPVAGTYSSAQSVVINTIDSGAITCFAINSTPTSATPGTCDMFSYTTPINISTTSTIQAFSTKAGRVNSPIVSATYTIAPATLASPTFSPAAGSYSSSQTITLSGPSGATICYAIGSTPAATTAGTCSTGTTYSAPFTVSTSQTVQALSTKAGNVNSSVASAAYTIASPAASPLFSPATGTYTSAQTVALSSVTSGAVIYYTTDGSTPTTSSTHYTAPISVSTSQTIKAIATAAGFTSSSVATATYTINITLPAPTFSPSPGTYTSSQSVTISGQAGAVICYAIGAAPTAPSPGTCGSGSTTYSVPILVSTGETIQALVTRAGYINSSVTSGAYVIAPLAVPTFTPAQGTYLSAQSVTIAGPTGATLCYAINTAPTAPTPGTCGSGSTTYTAAISVPASETIQVLATQVNHQNSATVTAAYVISTLAPPTFSPAVGIYPSSQTVMLSAPAGATICYAVGTTPTATTPGTCDAGSTTYTTPITVGYSETILAITTKAGMTNSSASVGAYTITSAPAVTCYITGTATLKGFVLMCPSVTN